MYIVLLLLVHVHCISFKIQHLQLISWLDCRVLAMRSFCCCPSLNRRLCSACLRWNRHSVRSKITGPADKQDHGINQISPPRKRSTTNGQLSSKIHFFLKIAVRLVYQQQQQQQQKTQREMKHCIKTCTRISDILFVP